MKLSIITINYNNAPGLQKTMESVLSQTFKDFEYIIIDGGSTDGSTDIIQQYESKLNYWISEPDNGIYHAMNKGIRAAKGEYLQFLNSGDCLVDKMVVENILSELKEEVAILYGNMMKQMPNAVLRDKGFTGRQPTLLDFYRGTLNHSSAYIKRKLFEQNGFYDENLKIVSDWKWYIQVIIMGEVSLKYKDIDITLFDMVGISSLDSALDKKERREVLEKLLPEYILNDYDKYADDIFKIRRINRFNVARKLFWLTERICFKLDQLKIKIYKESNN